jgi:hypothetical protein
MNALAPPKAAGGISTAAHLKRNYEAILLAPLTKINGAHQVVWQLEGRRLLREYWCTGNSKHLRAFDTHLCAMCLHEVRCAK